MNKHTLNKLASLTEKFKTEKRRTLLGDAKWKDNVPSVGGVYVIWPKRSNKAIYVGKTCHLKHRFADLGRTVNHSFRRKMAKELNLLNASELTLTKELSKRFSISFIAVELGRKELEEYLIILWKKTIINKPPKRLLLSETYASL